MPLEAELIALMLDYVTLQPAGVKDRFNKFTFGTPYTAGDVPGKVQCQIVRMNKRALNEAGREVTSTVQAILSDPTLPVSINDQLTLPDGTTPAIIEVLAAKDDTGPYYLEIRA